MWSGQRMASKRPLRHGYIYSLFLSFHIISKQTRRVQSKIGSSFSPIHCTRTRTVPAGLKPRVRTPIDFESNCKERAVERPSEQYTIRFQEVRQGATKLTGNRWCSYECCSEAKFETRFRQTRRNQIGTSAQQLHLAFRCHCVCCSAWIF